MKAQSNNRNKNQRIVFIPGLGADGRAFSRLYGLIETYDVVYANWLGVLHRSEPFDSYVDRMIVEYGIRASDLLVGLSFGGVVAQAIADKLGNEQVVLISSFSSKADLKPFFRFGLNWKLYRLLPSFRVPLVSDVTAFFLNSSKSDSRTLLKEMVKDVDFHFINWAVKQIDYVDMSNQQPSKMISLVGTRDAFVDVKRYLDKHSLIHDGAHFMVFDKSAEVEKEILQFVNA